MTEEQGQQEEIEVKEAQEAVEEESLSSPAEDDENGQVVDEVAALQQELEQARAKEAEYLDGWQRARAELSNARKRFQREQAQSYANAKADMLLRLLPIVDDFERAFGTLPEELDDIAWLDGVRLIQQKFQGLLEQEGVVPIETEGQEFDPFQHQAVTHEPSEDVPTDHVIGELQRGYMVGDRVLRPSMVRVSAGMPPEPEEEAQVEAEPEKDAGAEGE